MSTGPDNQYTKDVEEFIAAHHNPIVAMLNRDISKLKTKLDVLCCAIVTAGGPEQTEDMSDEEFIQVVSRWFHRPEIVKVSYASSTRAEGSCGCRKP